jgi:15-cis-phytoene synthase
MISLSKSYAYCRRITRARAKNFYYSFILLSTEQRNAMCAMYAFMRFCDDLSDEPGATAAAMQNWRASLERALNGHLDDHPLWPAFQDAVLRYRIPNDYFFKMIEGVQSDLTPREIHNFDDLYQYCYRVASVVGLTTIHIFGFSDPHALDLAEKCGIAFQLTNILRDVREDAELGRVYLPTEDLQRFEVRPDELLGTERSDRFLRLMEFEADRARRFYDQSRPLIGLVDGRSRSSLWVLITIYSRLLDKIRTSNFDVLQRRISLSTWEKVRIAGVGFATQR